ncbi:MAG: glycosyltransferase [Acidobacteriales bacterium]|nr:glycosyltransferase [Terriglobales bacterium]
MALALSLVCLGIWLWLFGARSRFWRLRYLPAAASASYARVTAVIPARNEAEFVQQSLNSLLPSPIRVIVVDDESTDGTGELARRSGVEVISVSVKPSDWAGKVWAMQQGWQRARESDTEFLLFTDADIVHGEGEIDRLIQMAQNTNSDLASLMVRLHCESFAEKLLIPAFVYFFFLLYPPLAIADPAKSAAGAAGGCMLVRRHAMDLLAGFSTLRSAVIDDCALARAIKDRGGKVSLMLADNSRSVRPYGGWRGIRDMIARTAFYQLQHSWWLLLGCVLGMLLTFAAPLVLLVSEGTRTTTVLAAAACLLMFATYVPIVRYYKLSFIWAVSLPFAAAFYVYATVVSAVRYRRGTGAMWKARVQDPA